jgi:hypothetical protein
MGSSTGRANSFTVRTRSTSRRWRQSAFPASSDSVIMSRTSMTDAAMPASQFERT